jgi:SAM-dependent methyltransferase
MLGGDERGVRTLLDALSAMGLFEKEGDRYRNSSWSKAFLVKDSPEYIGYMIMHHHHLVPAWAGLSDAVVTGRPTRRGRLGENEREAFLLGMFNLAMAIAPQLSREIDLKGREHLIDIGGGPGTYAIHFCLANPQLRSTVYDLGTTRPFALETIKGFGLSDRIDFMEGDYTREELRGSYDVAWLSQILHGEGPEMCKRLIEQAVSVLKPGGLIFIHEFILDNTMDAPIFPAIFSLNMLVNTEAGRSYSEDQIGAMLSKAGVKDIRRLPFRGPNASGIMRGQV